MIRQMLIVLAALFGPTAAMAQDPRTMEASELIVAPRAGAVQYAVVSFDGWLWRRDKQYLYPVTALATGDSPGEVTLQIDKEDLGTRTGVDDLERRPYEAGTTAAREHPIHASALLGSRVVNRRGEDLGTLSELIFDARNGALRYVVVGQLAFPASRLEPQAGGKRYVLRGPHDAHAVAEPVWPAMRTSALIDREVVDRLHRDFGEIRDLVVDLGAQRVRGAIVDRRDDWKPGRALLSVPIEALSIPRDLGDKVALNYSRERFE